MVSKFSQWLPRELVFVFSNPTYSGVSALFTGFDILWKSPLLVFFVESSAVQLLVWRCLFRALDHPKVLPDYQGFPKFSEGLLRDFKQRPSKFVS